MKSTVQSPHGFHHVFSRFAKLDRADEPAGFLAALRCAFACPRILRNVQQRHQGATDFGCCKPARQ